MTPARVRSSLAWCAEGDRARRVAREAALAP
jgi:hypothetical protein